MLAAIKKMNLIFKTLARSEILYDICIDFLKAGVVDSYKV